MTTPLGMYLDINRYKPKERSSTLFRYYIVSCRSSRQRNKAKMRFLKYVSTRYSRAQYKFSTFFWKNTLIRTKSDFLQK